MLKINEVKVKIFAKIKQFGKEILAAYKARPKHLHYTRDYPYFLLLFAVLFFLFPTTGYGTVESTLTAIQGRLIGTILPLVAILGILFAACSFALGSENARRHAILAAIGALIGFGAPSIIEFIRGLVQ